MCIEPILQKKHQKDIEKFYFDACKKHKTTVLSLQITSGFHQLGEYLEVRTEKGDTFEVQDGLEPVVIFNEVDSKLVYRVEVEEGTTILHEAIVQKLSSGKFFYRGNRFDNEAELIKHLEGNAHWHGNVVDSSSKILKSEWVD